MGTPRRLHAVRSSEADELSVDAERDPAANPPGPGGAASSASLSPRHSTAADAELAQALHEVAAGSSAAFERLYDLIADQVYGLSYRVLRDATLAEDAAQEALLEVWSMAPRFAAARGSARGWILTIAHRRAVDRVRREESQASRARAARSAAEVDIAADVPGRVVDALHGEWEAARVRRALAGLTELQREALSLAYWRGLTHREVADELGVPLGTAKARLRDGMIRLRETLEVAR